MSHIEIVAHKRSNNFTIVPNHIINAVYLKLEDKAFLIWVLSKPEDWKLSTLGLAKIHKCSKDKITAISKRLQKEHHLYIFKGSGGFTKWFVFENIDDCLNFIQTQKNTPLDTNDKPYPENQSMNHPEFPDPENQDTLLRTDPLPRTERDQDPCSQKSEHEKSDFDILFPMLKQAWPNNNNMKRAQSPFRAIIKGKATSESMLLVEHFKWDIKKRLQANQLGFNNMMLSTYLNGERWNDDYTNQFQENVDIVNDGNDKARELFNNATIYK